MLQAAFEFMQIAVKVIFLIFECVLQAAYSRHVRACLVR